MTRFGSAVRTNVNAFCPDWFYSVLPWPLSSAATRTEKIARVSKLVFLWQNTPGSMHTKFQGRVARFGSPVQTNVNERGAPVAASAGLGAPDPTFEHLHAHVMLSACGAGVA